ncbi:SET and MYND domain-containing protein 4-like [Aphidius gifuensis]|uniref:SET and MYND domain-containing protein 4-like n=1 Tax=Aphidius gifuensis TaxID=684658 RepID=UPI001CDC0853|nr:SET and MYND domain-containing protein 4-like [Aphidius gifuensis]
MNRLDQAFEEYTKSAAYAPSGSEECALAFANRSAVLFKCQLMNDCISDIKNALCANYPDNLKAKLYHRKVCCLKALNPRDPSINKTLAKARSLVSKMDQDKQKAMMDVLDHETRKFNPSEKIKCNNWNFEDTVPAFNANNPVIPGFSDAMEMKHSPQYGRHMVATRDIKPGELLGLQKPYARVVADNMRYKLCWHCGKQTWSSILCNTCGEVVFCSAVCRDEAHKKYHNIEC